MMTRRRIETRVITRYRGRLGGWTEVLRALRRSGRPICQSEYQKLARKRALRAMRWERMARSTPGSRGAAVMRERRAAERFAAVVRSARVVTDALCELPVRIERVSDYVVRYLEARLSGIGR